MPRVRPKCPFIHKIINEQERKDQNYIAKVPQKKNLMGKPTKGMSNDKKYKGEMIREIITRRGQMGCTTTYY